MKDSNKIHIMHIIGQIAVGGCEKQLLNLCRRMDHSRFKLTVCWYSQFPDDMRQEFTDAGVELVFIDKFGVSKPRFWFQLVQAIRRARPDIVHTWLYSANAWGRWAAVAARVPCIIASERVEILSSTWIYGLSERLLARWSTQLVNSRSVARSMERHYGVPLNRFHIAYNAVELPVCDPDQARLSIRRELGLAPDAKVVLMIGRLDPQKNWPMFIRVARRICRLRNDTYFVGAGSGALRDELLQMARNEGLEEQRLQFVGSKPDIHLWLAAADLFCFTSDFEGFPNAVLEAMATGLPVLCTQFAGVEELLDSSVACLVPRDDDEAMAHIANELLDDSPRRSALGEAARTLAKKNYSYATLVRTMEQFYETTLAAGKRPRTSGLVEHLTQE